MRLSPNIKEKHKGNKVLFILKKREDYNQILHSHIGLSTGLFNSATFANDLLVSKEIDSTLVVVNDNNDIDREVTKHKPTHVIIEALWVIPSKFQVLTILHPNVKWIIRLHSEIPFLAGEGMAWNWLGNYFRNSNVLIASNAPRMLNEVKVYLGIKYGKKAIENRIIYLPNYYPTHYKLKDSYFHNSTINIGCFGAIRPLKNQMMQAMAALDFADGINKKLYFHINGDRIEMKGSPVLNNLRALFANLESKGHKLVEHTWSPREDFIKLCASMDIGMQVSFSETFNIVSADFVSQGIPVVLSNEIPWSVRDFTANPTELTEISKALRSCFYLSKKNVLDHQENLKEYCHKTADIWEDYFTTHHKNIFEVLADIVDDIF